jgi:diphthamide biosynthesis methyltransferase
MNDISSSDTHVEINISKSKTDIYRRGNKVVIAKTGNKLCPVKFLKKYIEAANLNLHSCIFIYIYSVH